MFFGDFAMTILGRALRARDAASLSPRTLRSGASRPFGARLLAWFGGLLACCGAAQAADEAKPKEKVEAGPPNIVFIFSDDHALQAIGAYDTWMTDFVKKQNVTPNIDKLAAEGGTFRHCLCGNSLCSPSRASILTGLHSHANGVMVLDRPIKEGLWTFPRALKAAGYDTALFGKFHLASTRPETDDWRIFPGQGAYVDPVLIGPDGNEKHQGHASDVITDLALEWLARRNAAKAAGANGEKAKERPFFLAVQHKAPHRNWVPPERHASWLDEVEIPEPDTLFDDYANRASPSRTQDMTIDKTMVLKSDLKVDPAATFPIHSPYHRRNADFAARKPEGKELVRWKYLQYMKDYLRCVKSVDDSVGKIREALDKAGLAENTVVVYSSDQGFYLGEHGWFDKRWIYEESIHMPFIVRWPGVVKPGTKFTPMVQNIDFGPTFAEIAGPAAQKEVPAGLHGKSFVPLLRGEQPEDWRRSVYYHYYDPGHGVAVHYGVRTERYTLVHFPATEEWELFDREKDPKQLRSVYADPEYARVVEETKAELTRLRTAYGDETVFPPGGGKQGGKQPGGAKRNPNAPATE